MNYAAGATRLVLQHLLVDLCQQTLLYSTIKVTGPCGVHVHFRNRLWPSLLSAFLPDSNQNWRAEFSHALSKELEYASLLGSSLIRVGSPQLHAMGRDV